jgi:hypothetical protein
MGLLSCSAQMKLIIDKMYELVKRMTVRYWKIQFAFRKKSAIKNTGAEMNS